MFDEKSGKWIKIFKGYTVTMFWLYALAGAIMCIVGWDAGLCWIDCGFLDGIICLAGGLFLAFVQLVVNMLIIQLLSNVQAIREKIANYSTGNQVKNDENEVVQPKTFVKDKFDEYLEKNEIYNKAAEKMARGNEDKSVESYKEAIDLFNTIKDHKNSSDLIVHCKKRIQELEK